MGIVDAVFVSGETILTLETVTSSESLDMPEHLTTSLVVRPLLSPPVLSTPSKNSPPHTSERVVSPRP